MLSNLDQMPRQKTSFIIQIL